VRGEQGGAVTGYKGTLDKSGRLRRRKGEGKRLLITHRGQIADKPSEKEIVTVN